MAPCHKNKDGGNNDGESDGDMSSTPVKKKKKKCHSILAAGGRRTVQVHAGAWDPFRVIDLCAKKDELDEKTRSELECLLEWEMRLLLSI